MIKREWKKKRKKVEERKVEKEREAEGFSGRR